MNIKNLKRKLIASIMSGILLLSAVPFTWITAMAAENPPDTMTVTTAFAQVFHSGGIPAGGHHFVMSDGSIAVCANHSIEAPQTETSLTLSRTLGDSYIDGDLGVTDTRWAFLCFYYSEKVINYDGTNGN